MPPVRRFFREMRRRHVFRTAALYVVASWAVLQVADLAFPALEIAAEAIRFVWVGVFLGFPVALVFGWRYQLTSAGIEKTRPLSSDEVADLGLETTDFVLLAALSTVLILIVLGVAREIRDVGESAELSIFGREIPENSIAVLPLDNLTGDPQQEFFTIGLQEALIADLSKISGLRVTSLTSSRMYAGVKKAIPEIGRELGVASVVEGTVQRVGDMVRIRLQLIDTDTDELRWSENYDRELRDMLVLQGEVARTVANQVNVRMTPDEVQRLTRKRRVDPDVYALVLKGMYFTKQLNPTSIEQGFVYLNEAINISPREPLAYAALALGYNTIGHGINAHDAFPKALAAARKALEIDEYSGAGWAALAEAQMYYDWDWKTAEESMLRALQLSPSLDQVHAHYAYLKLLQGKIDEAIAESETARDLSPLDPLWAGFAAWIYMLESRWDEAMRGCNECLSYSANFGFCLYTLAQIHTAQGNYELALDVLKTGDPRDPFVTWALGPSYAMAGRRNDALEIAALLDEQHTPRNLMHISFIYSALGEIDTAIAYLELSYEARTDWLPWVAFENAYGGAVEPMRKDPRFQDLIGRLMLPMNSQ